ncbi:MAG: TolC family protein [Bacteroidetes bacterium]|nr:TolC family protein [Bacteroidota bacterium]
MKNTVILFFLSILILTESPAQDTLTLFDAIQTGLENNFSISISRNEMEIARNNNTLGNAGFLPELSLNAANNNTYNTTNQKTFAGTERNVKNARNISLSGNIALSWTLFDGFSMFTTKEMLGEMERMGELEARMLVESTVSAIVLNYYSIVQLKKMMKVLQEAVDLSLQRKTIAAAKFKLGSESELTLLQSSVDLNADSNRLIQQVAALKNAKANLNQLLSREPGLSFEVTDIIDLLEPLEYEYLIEQSSSQNIDLMISRTNLLISELDLKQIRSDRYPRLNFNAAYGYNQLSAQTGYLEHNQAYGPSFGFTLSYNLFNGFNTSRNIRNARININSAEISHERSILDVHHSIYILYNEYLSNLELVRLESANQEIARRNVEVALEKYRLGTINDIDLRATQQKQIDSQYQLLLAQFRTKQAETELLRISGELYKEIR